MLDALPRPQILHPGKHRIRHHLVCLGGVAGAGVGVAGQLQVGLLKGGGMQYIGHGSRQLLIFGHSRTSFLALTVAGMAVWLGVFEHLFEKKGSPEGLPIEAENYRPRLT